MTTNEDLIAEAQRETGHIKDPSKRERLIIRLADALEAAEARIADATRTLTELKPDPVLVEGSWIEQKDWPTILGNFMRSSAEYARDEKAAIVRVEAAKAALEGSEASRLAGEQKLAAVQAERDDLRARLRDAEARAEAAEARITAALAGLRARVEFNSGTHGDDAWWRGHVWGMKDALFEFDRILSTPTEEGSDQ